MVGRERGGQNNTAEAEKREARVRMGWRGCGPVSALPGYMNWVGRIASLSHVAISSYIKISAFQDY